MRAYGSTYSSAVASDVYYGDGCYGAPTRTDRIKSKNRIRGRRYLHKLGRKQSILFIAESVNDWDDESDAFFCDE